MDENYNDIAIIGMSGRFPGASNVDEFWRNLVDGVESISTFTDEELAASGIDVAEVRKDPNYVVARGFVKDAEWLDASFFNIIASEAALLDPQQRLFLEASWQVLEDAGYDPAQYKNYIGVYGGMGANTYFLHYGATHPELMKAGADRMTALGDWLTTRVAYKLNLRGPAFSIYTACSTSLVAVCQACQALLGYQCDIAIAGGVWLSFPQKRGNYYQEGGANTADGHCRPFDAQASGTCFSDGLGVVALKRLSEALEDGDQIYAVIRGVGFNNDGSEKVGFLAPSVRGQTEVITLAQSHAGVDPDTISYIEAHGTATLLGDPIEISALTQAFRAKTSRKNFCAIGSVKGNIGHADAASGVISLIKAALALKHKKLPATLHFKEPNPKIDFANSPFYVNSKLTEWKEGPTPRRAGVSAFGMGGTNAHVVLEEAPAVEPSKPSSRDQLLLLSAKTPAALDAATDNFLAHLKANPEVNLADAAYTLQVGRRAFPHRRMLVCRDVQDAIQALETRDPKRVITKHVEAKACPVVFMFPGQGAQYVNMGADLYRTEPVFQKEIDHCARILTSHLGLDLREVLFPVAEKEKSAEDLLIQTRITQPALFVIEYALAKLWMSWGITPRAMIGHSVGEYVAGCLAGVFTLEEGLGIVAARAQMVQALPGGAMVAVRGAESDITPLLSPALTIAAVNSPALSVVAGPYDAIEEFEVQLKSKGIASRRLDTSHAFHSAMMDPVVAPFTKLLEKVKFKEPVIPYVSNVTAQWITPAEARDPNYWAKHVRQTVRFADGIGELLKDPETALLEVGPGRGLATFANQHSAKTAGRTVLSSFLPSKDREISQMLTALGSLWLAGKTIDWSSFYAQEKRRRVSLPTYPFQRQRYCLERLTPAPAATAQNAVAKRNADLADWCYLPTWKRSDLRSSVTEGNLANPKLEWLIFVDEDGMGRKFAEYLTSRQESVTQVVLGQKYRKVANGIHAINPDQPEDYESLISELIALGKVPQKIVHFWSVSHPPENPKGWARLDRLQSLGLHSLLSLVRALGEKGVSGKVDLEVVSNNVYAVTGEEKHYPEKSTLLGACKVIPLEYSNVTCRHIDIVVPKSRTESEQALLKQLLDEFSTKPTDLIVAFRAGYRWVETFDQVRLGPADGIAPLLKANGVYLITGGLGGIGLALAEFLATKVKARLILTARSGLPPKDQWAKWLATHDDEDDKSIRIKKVQSLESAGAEVLVLAVDVTDRDQMRQAIASAKSRFGPINGVVHAAGSADYAGLIQLRTKEATEEILASKTKGTLVLNELMAGAGLDFFVLCSSVITVLSGGLTGQVGYAAANEFLDAFAAYKRALGDVYTVSIGWDNWSGVGIAAQASKEQIKSGKTGRALTSDNSLTPSEGSEIFNRILTHRFSRVVVSVRDLESRRKALLGTPQQSMTELQMDKSKATKYARPDVANAFTAPTTELERKLVPIWEDLCGIQEVGIDDNFTDLGGDSLLAVQMISQIKKSLSFNLSVPIFFQNPTIRKLAMVMDQENQNQHEPQLAQNNESNTRLITFQAKGSRPPLFFLHGDWAGGGFYCGRLSQRLGEDQPFYALPPYRSGRPSIFPLEEMVAYHLAVIREHTPHGPYLLGGYCAGAKVAMEIARELVKQGEDVHHLLLLDLPQRSLSWLHNIWPYVDKGGDILKWDLLKKIQFFDRYPVSLARWLKLSSRQKAITICRRLGLAPSAYGRLVMGLEPGEYDEEILKSLDYAVYFLASTLFSLKPLSIPTTLYFSDESIPRSYRVQLAHEMFPTVTVEMVPGNHVTCITKYASTVADKMHNTLGSLSLPVTSAA
jgi:acyl transferase domain-containing protein/acyl carrier protein